MTVTLSWASYLIDHHAQTAVFKRIYNVRDGFTREEVSEGRAFE